jgi:hypothetical protein
MTLMLGATTRKRRIALRNPGRYFSDLHVLLAAMPPGDLDMGLVEANELRHGHCFYDPPETVHQWLLDEQRRAQTSGHPSNRTTQ